MSDSWKTGVSGDWGQARNWTGGVPNSQAEDVTIAVAGNYTVTVAAAESFQADNLLLDNNTATLDIAGNLYLAGSSTFAGGLFDLTGTVFEIGSSSLTAGSINLTGTLGGQGSLDLAGGTLMMDGGEITLPTISLAGADMVLESNFDYGGNFLESSGTFNLNGFNATLSGITELGTGGYTDDGNGITFAMITGPGNLDITNFAEVNSIFLSNGAVLQDNGIIVDAGYLYFGGYADGFYGDPTDSASMSISAGGVFDFVASSMPEEYNQFPITYFPGPASSIVNAGLFEITSTGDNPILPFFTNLSTGTIYAAAGADLQFTGGGVLAGKMKGPGELDLTGGTYALAAGLVINTASVAIFGEAFAIPLLQLNGNSTITGTAYLGEGADESGLSGADATIAGPGTLHITGTAYIDSLNLTGGAVLKDTGVITLNGNFDLGDDSELSNDTGTDSALLKIAAGGIFDIAAGGTIINFDIINGDTAAARIVNNGLFELTAGTSQNEVDGPFINNGTVAVYASTLLLTGISNDAAGTLTGGTWKVKSTDPISATLALQTPAAITTDDARIILSGSDSELLSGPGEATAIEQSLTSITSEGVLSLLSARGFTATANLTDAGTIVLQGGVFTAPTLDVATGGIFNGYGTLAGAINNDGLIRATQATLTITDDLSGTGSLHIDQHSELILEAAVGGGTDVTFGHSLAILGLDAPNSFSGTLVSFQASDTIELIGIASISSEHFSNGVLTLADSAGSIALTFANPGALSSGLVVQSAGGNTSITEAPPGAAGTQIFMSDAMASKLAFLRPTSNVFGEADTETVQQSKPLDAIFGQQLPLELFLAELRRMNANTLQVMPEKSASNFVADSSEGMTPMTHVHSLFMSFINHG